MLQLMYEILPVILFFFTFKWFGIYVATKVGIACTLLQVLISRFFFGKWDKKQCVVLLVFSVFGGLTLYFQNPIFVKWKPSIVFWLFALVLWLSQWLSRTSWLASMMSSGWKELADLPLFVWRRIEYGWIAFLIAIGAINLWVAYHYSDAVWVNFKFYGISTLMIVSSIVQALYLSMHMQALHKQLPKKGEQ